MFWVLVIVCQLGRLCRGHGEMRYNINYQVWMTYFVPSHGPVSVQSS